MLLEVHVTFTFECWHARPSVRTRVPQCFIWRKKKGKRVRHAIFNPNVYFSVLSILLPQLVCCPVRSVLPIVLLVVRTTWCTLNFKVWKRLFLENAESADLALSKIWLSKSCSMCTLWNLPLSVFESSRSQVPLCNHLVYSSTVNVHSAESH